MKKFLLCVLLIILFSYPAFAGVPVTGVSLDKSIIKMTIGGLSDYPSNELTATVTPANATNMNVIWSCSNKTIATVSARYGNPQNAFVSGINPGSAIITATTEDGSFTDTCTVEVIESDSDIQIANVRYSSDKNEVAAKMAGFSEGDFELVDGSVVIKKSIAKAIVKNLLKTNDFEIVLIPWFEATNWSSGKIAAICNLASSSMFIEEFENIEEVEEILVLSITSPQTGEFLKQADIYLDDYEDGEFSFMFVSIFPMKTVPENRYVTVFISDGGKFDNDKTKNGSVVGQIAVVGRGKLKNNPTDPKDPVKSSGGGCNSAYGGISLLLGVLVCCFGNRLKKVK